MSITAKPKNSWIQILRAISVLAVIAYHFDLPVSNGFIGVDIFFVISGYVITQSLIRSDGHSWTSILKFFYVKRIARLFPAFLAVFVSTIIASILFLSPNQGVQQNAIKSSLGATLGISNYVIPRVTGDYFGTSGNTNPFQHTWSLSVEEQFYFIFPFIFLFLIRKKIRRGSYLAPTLLLSVLAVVSFSIILPFVALDQISNLGTTQYFAPQNRAWQFLAGVIAAVLPTSRLKIRSSFKPHLLVFLCGSIIVLCISNIFSFQANLYQTVVPVLLASVFLFVSDISESDFAIPTRSSRIKESLVTLGDWSYSLYLWHWPVWIFTTLFFPEDKVIPLVLATFLTFIFSALTYKLIEKRFNFSKRGRVSYWLKFFLIGQALAILLFFVGYQGVSKGWGQDWALNSHAIMQKGCDSGLIDLKKCSWGDPSSKEIMFITGDSMSWAIGDAFINAASERNISVNSLTRNGCSITLSKLDEFSDCGVWRKKAIETLLTNKPEIVVIANSAGYPEKDLRGMGELVKLLRESSIKVIFVLPPPGGDVFSGLRALAYRPGAISRDSDLPEKIDLSKYGLTGAKTDRSLILYNPSDALCGDMCTIAKDGNDYYNYGQHLSVYGNKVLQTSINKSLEDVLDG
jgi:peptidoglycan/LPS O-acetylase OafA/YrhL